jgi:hypothetical protein
MDPAACACAAPLPRAGNKEQQVFHRNSPSLSDEMSGFDEGQFISDVGLPNAIFSSRHVT